MVAALCSANADVCHQRGAGAPGKTVARSNGHKGAVRLFFFFGRGARMAEPRVRRWMWDSGYLLMAALDM